MTENNSSISLYHALSALIADDSLTSRKFMKEILRGLNFGSIAEASDGKIALEMLSSGAYDVVISDWEMPLLNGLELFTAIQNDSKTRHIKFLMVTSHSKREEVMKALQVGISSFVIKPYNTETVEQKLRELFNFPK